jgi:hypothetical protein
MVKKCSVVKATTQAKLRWVVGVAIAALLILQLHQLADVSPAPSSFLLNQTQNKSNDNLTLGPEASNASNHQVLDANASLVTDSPFALSSNVQAVQAVTSMLPGWMQEYIEFHRNSIQDLNETNWQSKRYLIVSCYNHRHCGGTADRLQPIPLYLLLAARSKRIIYVRWNSPYALEEFMLPVTINWTVPEWFGTILNNNTGIITNAGKSTKIKIAVENEKSTVVVAKMQEGSGEKLYATLTGDHSYESDYHYIFRAFFQPSPPIAKIVSEYFTKKGLTPGEYAVAHQRATYAKKSRQVSRDFITADAINAVNCASTLMPGSPVVFASDTEYGAVAISNYSASYSRTILTMDHSSEKPVHLALGRGPVSLHYPTFVDLWIMGSGRCVAYGKGGFGLWALFIGYNSSCRHNYLIQPNCTWADAQ